MRESRKDDLGREEVKALSERISEGALDETAREIRAIAAKLSHVGGAGIIAALDQMSDEERQKIAEAFEPLHAFAERAFHLSMDEKFIASAATQYKPQFPYKISLGDVIEDSGRLPHKALTYDDISLESADHSMQETRFIKAEAEIVKGVKSFPIIPANMQAVLEPALLKKIVQLGGYPIVHRYDQWDYAQPGGLDNVLHLVEQVIEGRGFYHIGGMKEGENPKPLLDAIGKMVDKGLFGVFLDTANGTNNVGIRTLRAIRKEFGDKLKYGAGNIHTFGQAKVLVEEGADVIKAGVGGGSMCSTPLQTGVGKPLVSTILEVAAAARPFGVSVIADGAIKKPGDLAKAMVCGANAGVMVGGLYAKTEPLGDAFEVTEGPDNRRYRLYYGEASKHARDKRGKSSGAVEEGQVDRFEIVETVDELHARFIGGLQSAMTYHNVGEATELCGKPFNIVSTNYQFSERHPRPESA